MPDHPSNSIFQNMNASYTLIGWLASWLHLCLIFDSLEVSPEFVVLRFEGLLPGLGQQQLPGDAEGRLEQEQEFCAVCTTGEPGRVVSLQAHIVLENKIDR